MKMTTLEKIQEWFDPMIAVAHEPEQVPNGFVVRVVYDLAPMKLVLFRNDDERNYTTYRSPLDAASEYQKAMNKKRQRQEKNRSYWYAFDR